jgi:outer membrane protein OmpA-like peptidoglycan-associated protein
MRHIYKYSILTVIFLACSFLAEGQTKQLKKANKKYNEYEYINATNIYLEVANSGYQSKELYTRLSNALYFNARYREASTWYKALYDLRNGKLAPKVLLRYAQSLKAIGRKRQAAKVYDEFLKATEAIDNEFSSAKDYLAIIEKNSHRYQIDSLPFNSKNIDFGTFSKDGTIYFSSSRYRKKGIKRIDTWTNESFLDIYISQFDKETQTYTKPTPLKGDVNTKYHESSPVITKDGKTMYFTRSNSTKQYKEDKKAITQLKIYRASMIDGKWTAVEDLAINGETFSNAHPVLNSEENRLFYVSNIAGGFGATDLYYVDILEGGKLGKPVNMGPKINTKGRESFPFVTTKNELYFSSDGHFGLGGYDVFYLDLSAKEKQLVNIGKPINSSKDDYAFSIDNDTKQGFFSSNRGRSDDVYSLLENQSIKEILERNISGIVVDKGTNFPIPNAMVTIRDADNKVVKTVYTDTTGAFNVSINRFQLHILLAQKELYNPESTIISKQEEKEIRLSLEKNAEKIEEGVDIAKLLNVVIYFDFDKAEIREDAKVELEKVRAVLEKHPEINLILRAHTDSKGKDDYNMKLSDRRAKASMNYLIKKGIRANRLTAKGFGESEILNKCKNGEDCTEKEHQLNRRTEFIIKKN